MSINDMAFGEPELGSKSFPAWEMVVNSQFHNLRPIFHARNDFLFGLAWTGRVGRGAALLGVARKGMALLGKAELTWFTFYKWRTLNITK